MLNFNNVLDKNLMKYCAALKNNLILRLNLIKKIGHVYKKFTTLKQEQQTKRDTHGGDNKDTRKNHGKGQGRKWQVKCYK